MSRLLLLALLSLLSAGAAHAQAVAGTLRSGATRSPVDGASVVLLDARGRVVAGTLTDPSGNFHLRAPAAGEYRLRAERIGFASTTSSPLRLRPGQTARHSLVTAEEVVELAGITVESARRCVVRPEVGLATATVWEEARKALSAAELTRREERLRFEVELYDRVLEYPSLRVLSDRRRRTSAVADLAFASIPEGRLRAGGFVQETPAGTMYYAPDARVLLSDGFLDTHCFRLVDSDSAALIGLAFEPAGGSGRVDIEGVMWLDRATNRLRRVDYRYRGLGLAVPTSALGGRVEFEALPTGEWFVRRWWIRMPVVADDPEHRAYMPRSGHELAAVAETGGEVGEVGRAGRALRVAAARGVLSGTVFDSASAGPLAGATVFLDGTSYRAETDSAGHYRMEGIPPGRYRVSFLHPRLEELGAVPEPRPLTVTGAGPLAMDLAVPASAGTVARRPSPADRGRGPGGLAGKVVDATSGAPIASAQVSLEGLRARTLTREDGSFRLEGVPPGTHRVRVRHLAFAPAEAEIVVERDGPPRLRVELEPRPIALEGVVAEGEARRGPAAGIGGFYERMENPTKLGYFISREKLDSYGSAPLSDVLASIPNMILTRTPDGAYHVGFRRAAPSVYDFDCPPMFFRDGIPYPIEGDVNRAVTLRELEGIEVYPAGRVPPRFGGARAGCGVIVLWSRQTA